MKKEISIKPDNSRLAALQESEYAIRVAMRKGVEATRTIATHLKRIQQEELYTEVETDEGPLTSFGDYVEYSLDLNRDSAWRIMRLGEVAERIALRGLPLPANDSQLSELAGIEEERQAEVWERTVKAHEKAEEPITAESLRLSITMQEQTKPKPRGIHVPELDDVQPKSTTNGEPVRLSERGEEALERIGRLCGEPLSEAILERRIAISETELIKWNEQDDDTVRQLVHYIVNLGWSVTRALAFENRDITSTTPVGRLIDLARARGGKYRIEVDQYEIQVFASA